MCKECPETLHDTSDCQHLSVGWFPLKKARVDPETYRLWAFADTAFSCEEIPPEDGGNWKRAVCAKNTVYLDAADLHVTDMFVILCQRVKPRPTDKETFDVTITTPVELHMAFIRTRIVSKEESNLHDQE